MNGTLCELRNGIYHDVEQRKLGYHADRSDPHVYCMELPADDRPLSHNWRIEDYRDERTGERWIMLVAADTARPGMPENPTPEEAWAHLPLYLCLIGNDIRLSGTGVIRDTFPEVVVPVEAGRWRVLNGDFQSHDKTVSANWLESVAYPGAYLSYNMKDGALDSRGPLGLNHQPNKDFPGEMSWIINQVALQPA